MGRHSRYPAVNRGVSPETPKETPAKAPKPVETPRQDEVVEEEVVLVDDLDDAIEDDNGWAVEPEVLAEMSTQEILDWVGNDEARADYAVEVELGGRERKTLLRKLRRA